MGVTLNGTVSDDGLPAGSTVTTTWSKASGADPVTFANASAAQTAVSLTNAGTYVLRLTASDSALSANSNVTITVNPGNAAPTVNAGTNQTIELPNTASLSGSVADDGKPLGSTVTTRWSVTSGTGTVTFANPNTAATTASFSAPGTYVLRLAADDTDAVTTSEITITVKPQNLAPVVNAGPDVAVALPGSATLNGTATDDGQPNNTLTVAWSKVSGPGTVTFSAPNAAMTNAAFSVAGSYTLRLTATDGVLTTSDDVIVTVSPANQAPIVNAGADQLITFPANTTLAGTATDDGYPTGSSVSVTWSKVSGPGTVTFINVASLTTTASFSVSGVYTLRLMASDGALSSADDVVITVNQPPTVSAGAPQTITQNGNLIQNPSGDGSGGGGLGGWSEFGGGGWGAISGGFGGALGGFYFQAGNTATAELRQDTDVSGYATTIDATLQEFDLSGFVRSGAETPADSTRIIWEFRDAANANVLGSFDSGVITATTNWQAVTGKRLAPVGTRYIRIRLIGVRNSGTTNDAYFDGLAVRPTANAGVVLNGTATDDGLGGTLASTWSQVSGPGAVTFTNPNNATTGATFSAPGTYVLKLTATDTNATTTSTVTVTIAAPNQAPVVSAGANQTIALPVTAALSGSVTDDGLPLGSTIENKWSVVSGPGNVTFTSLGSPVTTASFSAPGTYVLRLSANDTDRLTSADVTITVLPPNQAPIVNAGADQLLAFPTAANLNGIATDDGYPVGSSLALTWSKVSGPGTVTFSAPNALATSASFSSSGSYVLRLTATDGALTTSDDVVITVNQAPVVSAGTEQTISLGQTVTLTGTATDDGIPVGSAVSVVWSKVSGPGDVTFAAPTSLTTTATFSAGGIYILRLTASDSQLTSADDVRINVRVRKLPPEYWLTFPGALVVNGNPIQPALYISAPRPTTGRVEIAGLNFSQDFTVTGNGSVKISLPVAADLNTASDQILNRGIHITAQDQITVTAVNYAHFETDSYFALPISELGSQYLVLSYPTGSGYGTQFALAATVNNTSVTITPSAPVGARAAGVPYTITLNQGDVYQLTTSQLVDLSGTAISANKKIAVFGSNRCTQVPAGDPACNYLVEQLPSLEYFGTSFLAYPLVRRVGGDTYRFIASQNNTHVTVNEQLLATLN